MQLMVSRDYTVVDAQTLTEYVARDALFRTFDGSYFLYMASGDRVEGKERILFIDCRETHCYGSTRPRTRLGHTGISLRTRNSTRLATHLARVPSGRGSAQDINGNIYA
jgi:hypothetical protein